MRALLVAGLLSLGMVAGCHKADSADCDESYSTTALRHLPWGTGIPQSRKQIADLRTWANTLKDPCIKAAYLEWARYASESATQDEVDARTYAFPVPPGGQP